MHFRVIVLFSLAALLPSFVYAEVSKFSFTTEPQTISSNTLSGIITVQAQNSSGVGESGTTWYVTVTSSSATGQFFSNTTGSILNVPVTMASNSKNKNFYYQDSVLGTYIIKVDVSSEKGGPVLFSATQNISVEEQTSDGVESENATSTKNVSGGVLRATSNSVTYITYYSSEPLSNSRQEASFSLSAGQDRLGSVGSPLEFRADTDLDYTKNGSFKWNFGDGSEGGGEVLNHVYKYPGDYVVVLNVGMPGSSAIARANVKIIEPEIVITLATPEKVELQNNSKYEISLFGRALIAGEKIFAFPQDTIIKSGQKISFSANITKLSSSGLSDTSLIIVGTEIKPQEILAKVEKQKLEKITQINNQLSTLRQQLASLSHRPVATRQTESTISSVTNTTIAAESAETGDGKSQVASVANAITPNESFGMIKTLFQTLKRFFLRTQ
ncbi:MAG: PKD domain-containing protein [Patescibacteria group bacterium]